ncbi:MAG: sulfatase-like hydrolase/transferase [Verrucomicrobia bacterium]|nr:sulfatase-like hydrolase/transferase [Verrucomicrobiota bacterium]
MNHFAELLSGILLLLSVSEFSLQSASTQPNVITIFSDDHGWSDLGSQGVYDDIKTPHTDRLAANGVRFTSGYVTAPQYR